MNPEETKKKGKPKKTTLGELGPVLPIGIKDDSGRYHKDIAVRPWTLKEERELGKARGEGEGMRVGRYVNTILSTLCTRLGPHDLEGMELAKRQAVISTMLMPDVFYAYCWLRREAIGNELELEITCGKCSPPHAFPYSGLMDSLEVTCVDQEEDARFDFQLETPIMVRGTKISLLSVGPQLWNVLEILGDKGIKRFDTGAAKAGVIYGSIKSVGELGEVPLAEGEIDTMRKRDFERLSDMIDERGVGPVMTIEGDCPKCKRKFQHVLEWASDDFFAISSR